jgi:integrase
MVLGSPNRDERMKTQKKMLNVHFFLRDGETNTEPTKNLVIYYQLEIEGYLRDTPKSTKIKIPHKYWWNHPKSKLKAPIISKEGKFQWILQPFQDANELNQKLFEMRESFKEIFQSLQTFYDEVPSYQKIHQNFNPANKKNKLLLTPTFLKVLDETIKDREDEKKIVKSTKKTYNTRRKNIATFFSLHYSERILVTEIKYKHIKELQKWMISVKNEDKSPKFGIDHINKHASLIKQTLDFALNQEYIEYMPVAKLNLSYSKPKPPNYLNAHWREKIEKCDAHSVQKVKDVAIFLMYTGFSHTDYMSLRNDDLQGACFKKQRDKSSIFSLPPLLPQAAAIIEKYGSIEKIPRFDISDLNKLLKHLGDYCGINIDSVGFNLSTSDFRETFGSMMENEFMLPRSIIKFMMGHTNEKQLTNYSSVMPSRILYELEKHWKDIDNEALKEYALFIEEFRKAG